MKAIKYYGKLFSKGYLKKVELDIPSPSAHQVLIKVKGSSLNIIDFERFKKEKRITTFGKVIKIIQGGNKVLGGEVTGTVIGVGKFVTDFKIGDEVYGPTIGFMQYGGWAEYALCERKTLCKKPNSISMQEAAVVSLSGLTAIGAIEVANIKNGENVLVYGASGGVGLYVLQALKAKGVHVTAVCSRRNIEIVRSFHADAIICYQDQDFSKCGQLFDKIISVNGFQKISIFKKLLKQDGQYVVIGNVKQAIHAIFYSFLSKKVIFYSSMVGQNEYIANQLNQLLREQKIKPYIDRMYRVEDVDHAINYVINKHAKGKVALFINFEEGGNNG